MSVIHRPASAPANRRLAGLVAAALALGAVVVTSSLLGRPVVPAQPLHMPAARPSIAAAAFDAPAALALGADALQRARETADPAAYAQAETAFRSVLAVDPTNVSALIGLGSLSLSRHEFAEALAIGRRAWRTQCVERAACSASSLTRRPSWAATTRQWPRCSKWSTCGPISPRTAA